MPRCPNSHQNQRSEVLVLRHASANIASLVVGNHGIAAAMPYHTIYTYRSHSVPELFSARGKGYQGRGGIASYRVHGLQCAPNLAWGLSMNRKVGRSFRAPIGVMAKAARRGLARPTAEGFPSDARFSNREGFPSKRLAEKWGQKNLRTYFCPHFFLLPGRFMIPMHAQSGSSFPLERGDRQVQTAATTSAKSPLWVWNRREAGGLPGGDEPSESGDFAALVTALKTLARNPGSRSQSARNSVWTLSMKRPLAGPTCRSALPTVDASRATNWLPCFRDRVLP